MEIVKNRNRDSYSFANINVLGRCNADCFFCLGKDIKLDLAYKSQLQHHYAVWKNFEKFLDKCNEFSIKKLYLTGQTTEGLQYKYIDPLINYLQEDRGFEVGVRTNGYLAEQRINTIKKMKGEIGYSVHSLNPAVNKQIMGRSDIPNWSKIIPQSGPDVRVSVVINRFNRNYIYEIMRYISTFHNVNYIQLRKVSTDTRYEFLKPDMNAFESFYKDFASVFHIKDMFAGAEIYQYRGIDVVFWKTTETTSNSLNYFTDGTISDEYFVVEGYLKYMEKG